MKKLLCLVCAGLPTLVVMHCTSFAQSAQQNSAAASGAVSPVTKMNGQSSAKKIEQVCEEEWRANRDFMMRGGMTEDRYVQQCVVRDDVPAIPPRGEDKRRSSSAPK